METYLAQKATHRIVDSILEKSPPNILRYKDLQSTFKKSRFVINNRNPYAYISSIVHRNSPNRLKDATDREITMKRAARSWINHSTTLRGAASSEGFPLLTYEEFCRQPANIFAKFGLSVDPKNIDGDHSVNVKDYQPQPIRNMNEEQISRLLESDIKIINQQLAANANLLDFFGYEILN